MTSSNLNQNRVITPERASVILPTIISSLFALIIIFVFVIPKYVKSNKVNSELKEFLRKKEELPKLKLQYKIISEKLKKLNDRKEKIIYLVTGKTNLETLLERIEYIGNKNNIEILSLSPKSITSYVPLKKDAEETSPLIIDPLLAEGVKKYTFKLDFESNFNDTLSFLRELEFQESVILFRDLKLKLKDNEENISSEYSRKYLLEVSMEIIVYGKNINNKKQI
ncbi:hypothetical protein HA151_03465 [Prochlorococcus marinus XMU1419]|uniref:hypothetical protein n=1 Tax=Prochlorococcus marinus TaxID=1219 RepID=UPI001ADD24BD|nr:hypothetical protein [Prochlorococcus marinus]MBO8233573.1 hypothetical protein [Prochlorococcus marinus XMU1419]MBW3077053.1 hypothetical protein [Prochlorococcus marinus str. XMU1419]